MRLVRGRRNLLGCGCARPLVALCHRFLNAVEPGTVVDVHRHPGKDETFVLLRGKVVVKSYNDDGSVIESVELCPNDGKYGVNIPRGGMA